MEDFKALLDKVSSVVHEANVDAVFGEPEHIGERVLIPVAEVSYGFGAGVGSAPGGAGEKPDTAEATEAVEISGTEEEALCDAPAIGGGGGAGMRSRPLAYIEVGPDGVKVQPIMDEQKIALAGIALAFWLFGWLGLVLKAIFKKS